MKPPLSNRDFLFFVAWSSQTPPHGDRLDSVPQIINLLDWHDSTDHYIMVLERSMHSVHLFCFAELHVGSLDEGTAWNVIQLVINAANVCCERGVFDCDIKLKNLLINQDTMKVTINWFRVRCTYEGLCLYGHPWYVLWTSFWTSSLKHILCLVNMLWKCIKHQTMSLFSRNKSVLSTSVQDWWQVPCKSSDCVDTRVHPVWKDVRILSHSRWPAYDQWEHLVQTWPVTRWDNHQRTKRSNFNC